MWSMGQQPGCHLELVKKTESWAPPQTYCIRICILSRVFERFNEHLSSVLPPTLPIPIPIHTAAWYVPLIPLNTRCRSLGGVRGGMKKALLTWDLQFGAHWACRAPVKALILMPTGLYLRNRLPRGAGAARLLCAADGCHRHPPSLPGR